MKKPIPPCPHLSLTGGACDECGGVIDVPGYIRALEAENERLKQDMEELARLRERVEMLARFVREIPARASDIEDAPIPPILRGYCSALRIDARAALAQQPQQENDGPTDKKAT